ncbi:ER degradation-enhancing alpha-mannosidase-like protein 3 [Nymphon striatum]|nr:ER degradation-enhancing alpha-mannosidase-like protein 3 [Nymphon striatum]
MKIRLYLCMFYVAITGYTVTIVGTAGSDVPLPGQHQQSDEERASSTNSKPSETKQPMMSVIEKHQLRDSAKEMFYHAYNSYMTHAYPADELMPLSCKGRYRGSEPSRGDIDETLGNFSLTLVDTLDTLAVMGDLDEFEKAAHNIVDQVKFDHDIVVSVFETNIRMLGGLLSGHILASYIHDRLPNNRMQWYTGQLLNMAKELGYRLLPAFNTTTGLPTPKINLRHGLDSENLGPMLETCTACAGTMILEFAALSRLSGESIFEEKARKAMDYLWELRHRSSDLMGTIINIQSGDWVRRESGVGAGIDSYYEYCLKAYILLGDESYLQRFNAHYSAVMKYISQGPMLIDVHMHRPYTNSKNFMDALLAFWPGLQVLKGDIKPAIETHEMLYQVMKRHNFLPEAFTTDFQVHWGQHPLRPEFVESTYFLYKATGDPYYLQAGKNVLLSLEKHARVPCGFAAVKDVRTGSHEDRMDSFVLAETFKYLYLLFAEKQDLLFDLDEFIFTTEAHLFPLTLARLSNATILPPSNDDINYNDSTSDDDEDFERSCPTTNYLFPGHSGIDNQDSKTISSGYNNYNYNYADAVRKPLENMVEQTCPSKNTITTSSMKEGSINVRDFQATNEEHLKLLNRMGISVIILDGGRLQFVQTANQASSQELAEEGAHFIRDMIEYSKQAPTADAQLRALLIKPTDSSMITMLNGGSAQFGADLTDSAQQVTGRIMISKPNKACSAIANAHLVKGSIAIVQRGDCMFVEKARHIQKAGAIGGIVFDNHADTSSESSPFFSMSGDGSTDITIPMIFLFSVEAQLLLNKLKSDPLLLVSMTDFSTKKDEKSVNKKVKSQEDIRKVMRKGSSATTNEGTLLDFSEQLGISTKKKDVIMNVLNKLNERIKDIKQTYNKKINSAASDKKCDHKKTTKSGRNKANKISQNLCKKKVKQELNYCTNPLIGSIAAVKHLQRLLSYNIRSRNDIS